MKINKKFLGPVAIVAGLAVTVLSFQNCANNQSASSSSTDSNTATDSSTTSASVLTYPNTTPVYMVPGQSVTVKFLKPAAITDLTNWVWYAYNDGHALASHFGTPVENNGYLYISVTLRSDWTTTSKDVRVYLYNKSTQTYLDGNGVVFRLTYGSTSSYTGDAVAEMCQLSSAAYVPTFIYSKTAAAADALYVYDNGAGIGYLSCSWSDSSGNTTSAVDCLNTSAWPSGWASMTLNLYATNRCGTSFSHSY